MRTYNGLLQFKTFSERLNYLKCLGHSFEETFGPNRYINQEFYRSYEWKNLRNWVIDRDQGLDLGLLPIRGKIMIHHIEPLTLEDIENGSEKLLDMNNLICCSFDTHQLIHGFDPGNRFSEEYIPRERNDTCPWKI